VDPGVKYQPQESADAQTQLPKSANGRYYVFDQGLEKNYFQKRSNGELFIPKVWPGESVFVDYTLPDARNWWGDLHRFYMDHGCGRNLERHE
jgi:alpha-glucosidase